MDTQKETEKMNEQNNAKDISLKIISIPDKEWKEYRNQASQDELLTLGIGTKLWLNKTRKSALFFTLGLLLSVIIGALITIFIHEIAGIAVLALGYVIFCTLSFRRQLVKTSFRELKYKLSKENVKALNAEFKTSGGATVAEAFITIILTVLIEPFALGYALIGAVIPSLFYTKLVIPEGFGFEALEEVKQYYAERSFLSEVIGITADYVQKSGSSSSVVYKDEFGHEINLEEQPYVINDRYEKVYKDENGSEYISNDGGKTVHKKNDGE